MDGDSEAAATAAEGKGGGIRGGNKDRKSKRGSASSKGKRSEARRGFGEQLRQPEGGERAGSRGVEGGGGSWDEAGRGSDACSMQGVSSGVGAEERDGGAAEDSSGERGRDKGGAVEGINAVRLRGPLLVSARRHSSAVNHM